MTTIVERNSGDSGMSSALVAIVALIVIIGLGLFLFRAFPMGQTDSGGGINVDVEGQIPTGAGQ